MEAQTFSFGHLPTFSRLAALATLSNGDLAKLEAAGRSARIVPARREVDMYEKGVRRSLLLMDGWAYRMHLLSDGRRQILQFLLPGDLIDNLEAQDANGPASLTALTDIAVCVAPGADEDGSGLESAYASSRRLERGYLFRQITRLGRLSAYERIVDWLCEMHERLALSGCCEGNRMTIPLTQEIIADAVGLTSVHVNRTLQALRRDRLIQVNGRTITFLDHTTCQSLVNRPQGSAVLA
ncbi:Crp/Fnr family transcriptional regulator [Sphingobium sp.]|uniref:Crp/Fnr family transcriptional regulator n=1 Tax=Sphingobium sp. TaxID=1912891 RepID=UPI002CBB15BE|nr:Crp/Fnr family transcriptional regulator [Sphingobium sp.]HUD95324.1 Crp/Fnr family transcriptional regulator [Sphingobium sp.]